MCGRLCTLRWAGQRNGQRNAPHTPIHGGKTEVGHVNACRPATAANVRMRACAQVAQCSAHSAAGFLVQPPLFRLHRAARACTRRYEPARPIRRLVCTAQHSAEHRTAPQPRPHRKRQRCGIGKNNNTPVHHSSMPAEKEQTHTHSAIPAARWAGKNASGPALQRPANCRAHPSKHLHSAPQTGPYAHPRSAALPWRLAPIVRQPHRDPRTRPEARGRTCYYMTRSGRGGALACPRPATFLCAAASRRCRVSVGTPCALIFICGSAGVPFGKRYCTVSVRIIRWDVRWG